MGNLQTRRRLHGITAQLQVVCQKLPALRIIFITTIYQQKYPPAVECLEFPSFTGCLWWLYSVLLIRLETVPILDSYCVSEGFLRPMDFLWFSEVFDPNIPMCPLITMCQAHLPQDEVGGRGAPLTQQHLGNINPWLRNIHPTYWLVIYIYIYYKYMMHDRYLIHPYMIW